MFQSAFVTSAVMMAPTNNVTSPLLELFNETVLGDMVLHQRHSNLYYLLIPVPWLNLAVQMVFTRIIVGYLKSKPPLLQTGVLLLKKQLNDPRPGSLNKHNFFGKLQSLFKFEYVSNGLRFIGSAYFP